MSMPEAVFYQPRAVPLPRRIVTYLAVGTARLLATRSPRRIPFHIAVCFVPSLP